MVIHLEQILRCANLRDWMEADCNKEGISVASPVPDWPLQEGDERPRLSI